MGCIRIEHGFICGPDDFVNLSEYGAKVWMEWHHYLGPTFYRSESAIKPIVVPSRKTWEAFGWWQRSQKLQRDMKTTPAHIPQHVTRRTVRLCKAITGKGE